MTDKNARFAKRRGRPPKYSDVELFDQKVWEYFDACDERGEPYTIPGLAFYLGFTDRNAISEYAHKGEFSSTIKKARLRIEQQRNVQLLKEGNAAGKIFDLINNFGWKNEQKHQVEANVTIVAYPITKPTDAGT